MVRLHLRVAYNSYYLTIDTSLYTIYITCFTDTGWFTEDPFEITQKFGGIWKTSDFQAGDVLIFTMR